MDKPNISGSTSDLPEKDKPQREFEEKTPSVQEQIQALLPELQKLPDIAVILGNGVVQSDEGEYASGSKFIEITLFVDRPFQTAEEVEDIRSGIENLMAIKPNINAIIGIFDPSFGSGEKALTEKRNNTEPSIAFDILPFSLIEGHFDMLLSLFRPVYIDTLQESQVLFDGTNGKFEKLKNETIEKHRKK